MTPGIWKGMGLLARSRGRQAINPPPERVGAPKAQPAGPGVGKRRLTILILVFALLGTTVAIMVLNLQYPLMDVQGDGVNFRPPLLPFA